MNESAAVESYFDQLPPTRKDKVQVLHGLILERFPDVVVNMQYNMPTYKYAEGWVAVANQKNYVSLYTCSAMHLERFKLQNPVIKTGKGCINFRERDEIPIEDVRDVIEHAILHPKGK